MRISRRSLLAATGAGLGALVAGSLGGCAGVMKGDLAPRSGRRVVVVATFAVLPTPLAKWADPERVTAGARAGTRGRGRGEDPV